MTNIHGLEAAEMSIGTPVLLGTGMVHLAICDRTLCGMWVGHGTFGDYEVECNRCLKARLKRERLAGAHRGPVGGGGMMTIRARVTGVVRGERVYRWQVFRRVTQVELGFAPGTAIVQPGQAPEQARIHREVWNPRLGRYDRHVALIVREDVLLADILGRVTIVSADR